jgi:GTP-binding protein Era
LRYSISSFYIAAFMDDSRDQPVSTRAGIVALAGRPNVGKSTLLNALVGEKLSIVTARPQTTREAVRGILTRSDVQVVFIDTPGLMEPEYLLHRSMRFEAETALDDADAVLLLLDATRPGEPPPADVVAKLVARRNRLVVAINKIDASRSDALRAHTTWVERAFDLEPLYVSATAGEGWEPLLERLVKLLPESPFLSPEDDLAVQPVRFFVAELIRETVFEEYEQEIPYATAVRIEDYREGSDPVYVRAVIYVERRSQKGILIGSGGTALKRLGTRAREKIETFTGERVYLDLWVKVLPGWRRKAGSLKYLGYAVPPDVEPNA